MEIVEKLLQALRIEIPTGYRDEASFQLGVKPAKKEVELCRSDALAPQRRLALFYPFHNVPLGWQPVCALPSHRNKLPSAYLMRRRET